MEKKAIAVVGLGYVGLPLAIKINCRYGGISCDISSLNFLSKKIRQSDRRD